MVGWIRGVRIGCRREGKVMREILLYGGVCVEGIWICDWGDIGELI
jgi:hypothetical protein